MMNEKTIKDESNLILHEEEKVQKALLISVYHGSQQKMICEEHLDELALLARTFGIEVAEKIACPLRKFDASTYLSKGKLEELIEKAKELEVDLVIFDDEITPAQQRNLQKAFEKPVMVGLKLFWGYLRKELKRRKLVCKSNLRKSSMMPLV